MTTLPDAQQAAWIAICQRHYARGGYMRVATLLLGQYALGDALTLEQAIDWHPANIYVEGLRYVFPWQIDDAPPD